MIRGPPIVAQNVPVTSVTPIPSVNRSHTAAAGLNEAAEYNPINPLASQRVETDVAGVLTHGAASTTPHTR